MTAASLNGRGKGAPAAPVPAPKPGDLTLSHKMQLLVSASTDPGLATTAYQVLIQLVQHFNLSTARCDPSIGRLAKVCGRTERAIRYAIAELEKRGWIRVLRRKGRHGTNLYRPAFGRADVAPGSVRLAQQSRRGTSAAGARQDRSGKAEAAFRHARNGVAGKKENEKKRKGLLPLQIEPGACRQPKPKALRVKTPREVWEPRLADSIGSRQEGYALLLRVNDETVDALCEALEAGELDLREAADQARRHAS